MQSSLQCSSDRRAYHDYSNLSVTLPCALVLCTHGRMGLTVSKGWWWEEDERWHWHRALLDALGVRIDLEPCRRAHRIRSLGCCAHAPALCTPGLPSIFLPREDAGSDFSCKRPWHLWYSYPPRMP